MRSSTVAVVALTLGGALACSAADPLAPPTVASSLAAQRVPLKIAGGWVTSPFTVFDWLPGAVPDMDTFENLVRCESYAIEENLEWNSLLLQRQGSLITGTSRPEMGIQCYVITRKAVPSAGSSTSTPRLTGWRQAMRFASRSTSTSTSE